ncbi:glycosyltransferase family 4 protein [Thalassotalea sp. LPB0316]|uniref:glycosyltransferase family 4 protein n=1 Tax=Thalassotalea sp. LPB0316 TaxID=2769490 RepID=UPI001867570A|nr:glycosyltransferase family 4 protein [Thalassotalea sp. LPB0316]QOL26576.1 glycosyltransferase family 4 protein [Thalassotalea sp. LPB0316]
MKVVVIGAYPNSIVSFRGAMIKAMVDAGHQVLVMSAPASEQVIQAVESLGASFQSYQVERNGLNPFADLRTFWQLRKMLKSFKPDKVLAYTIKPVIWGGLACRLTKGVEFYGLITGLGYAFETGSLLRNTVNALVKQLYRISLRPAKQVIFQNNDNLALFVRLKLCTQSQARRVHGSGVSLRHYPQTPLPEETPTFLLIARLLGDKGIREYVYAAQQVKQLHPDCRFLLVGPEDSSPDKIDMSQIEQWHQRGTIEYLGETNNVVPFIQACHIYTLPSYHEGLPRTVLEAMSVGRPILTTDAVGCRDTVIDNKNGRLVKVKDANALAQAMLWFIANQAQWPAMAQASREFATELFDVDKVNRDILQIMALD